MPLAIECMHIILSIELGFILFFGIVSVKTCENKTILFIVGNVCDNLISQEFFATFTQLSHAHAHGSCIKNACLN